MAVSSRNMMHVIVFAAILLRVISSPTANLSYLLLAGFALYGRMQAIQALALLWLFSVLSPGIAAEASAAGVGRYVVLLGAMLSVFLRRRVVKESIVSYVVIFGVLVVMHSVFFSPIVDVSVLKAISFVLMFVTILAAWSELGWARRKELEDQLFYGLVMVMVVSIPLLAMPLGYLRNGTGFQGILNQPQAFGPTMAMLGAWAVCRWLEGRRPNIWRYWVVSIICFILVILSEARTAGFSMVLGVVAAIIIVPFASGRSIKSLMPNIKSKRILVIGLSLTLGVAASGDFVSDRFFNFLAKGGRANVSSVSAAYELSRGRLAQRMWENVKDDPYIGIGFGIASDPYNMKIGRDPILGLPISASIEKGVMPLAIWEELGLVGLGFLFAWLIFFVNRGAKKGVAPLAVGTTAILLNFGESTFFSPGGMGLLSLILFGWILSVGKRGELIKR